MNIAGVVAGGKATPNFETHRDLLVDTNGLIMQQRGFNGLKQSERVKKKSAVELLGFTPAAETVDAHNKSSNVSSKAATLPNLSATLSALQKHSSTSHRTSTTSHSETNVLIPGSTMSVQVRGGVPVGKTLYEQIPVTEAERNRRAGELVFYAKNSRFSTASSSVDSNNNHTELNSASNVVPGQYYATKDRTIDLSFHKQGHARADVLENIL